MKKIEVFKRNMKFCANLSFMFGEVDNLLGRYDAAKSAGFKAVECAFPYSVPVDQLKEKLKETGLKQVLLNTEPGDVLGFAARVGEETRFMESLKLSLSYCKELDVKLLHIMSGKKQAGVDKETVRATLKSNLEKAIPLLLKNDVVGLLEPINPNSIPVYNLDNYELAVDIIRDLNHPNLRLQLDVFHLQQIEGNLTKRIKELLPLVSHVQIAQVPERGEPDSSGEIDYKYILNLLEKEGYQGWIGLEYKPVGATVDGLKWINQFGITL